MFVVADGGKKAGAGQDIFFRRKKLRIPQMINVPVRRQVARFNDYLRINSLDALGDSRVRDRLGAVVAHGNEGEGIEGGVLARTECEILRQNLTAAFHIVKIFFRRFQSRERNGVLKHRCGFCGDLFASGGQPKMNLAICGFIRPPDDDDRIRLEVLKVWSPRERYGKTAACN